MLTAAGLCLFSVWLKYDLILSQPKHKEALYISNNLIGIKILEKGKMMEDSGRNKSVWGVWRDGDLLIARNGAIFPDICIKCGQPTQNKKKQAIDYTPKSDSVISMLLGGIAGMLYARSEAILFEFDIPACPACEGWGKLLKAIDADACSGSFKGAAEGFLMHLEKAPPKSKQGILGLS